MDKPIGPGCWQWDLCRGRAEGFGGERGVSELSVTYAESFGIDSKKIVVSTGI